MADIARFNECKKTPPAKCRHCTKDIAEGEPRWWDSHKDKNGPTCRACWSVAAKQMDAADKADGGSYGGGASAEELKKLNAKLDQALGMLENVLARLPAANATF